MAFPVAQHDDLLDCLARIEDPALRLRWPETFMSVPGSRGSELPKMTTNLNRPVRYARGHLRHRRSAQGRHPSGNDPGEQG